MIIHPYHLVAKHGDFYNYTVGIIKTKSGLKNKDDASYVSILDKLKKTTKISLQLLRT